MKETANKTLLLRVFILCLTSTLMMPAHSAYPALPDIDEPYAHNEICKLVKIEAERLPNLNIPRNSHSAFCLNGEVTVTGGHTKNFVPTPTAEYYKDGEWHLMQMAYPHDNALCVTLRSGKVLIAGGHSESMGVGQSYPVEEYDPLTHTFRGFCILSKKRTFASGAELDSGKVVVSGNWYAGDCIEMFDGDRNFFPVKDVSIGRSVPYMLRTSDGDVLILGNEDIHGKPICSDMVERLKGDSLRVPLLSQWQPVTFEAPFPNDLGFIGDESKGDYSYLLAMQDWNSQDTTASSVYGHKLAFMVVRDTTFSLLPTTCSVPKTGVTPSDSILWYSPLIADRKAQRAYLHGCDLQGRSYILCVEYAKNPAPLILYYTDPLPEAGFPMIVLTDEGDLMMVGGYNFNKTLGGNLDSDNFSPLASVFLLHVGEKETPVNRSWLWLWLLIPCIVLVVAILRYRKHKTTHPIMEEVSEESNVVEKSESQELMQRICELMENQQLYLDSNLKLTDVAAMLGTNRNVVSVCINSKRNCSFSQFVGEYRIAHAKNIMRREPGKKISEVWMASGFSTETSFFRTFKSITGMTPNEYKMKND